jgi:hypothetical protein
MKAWIRNESVPLDSLEGFRKVLRKARAGLPVADWWGSGGRPIAGIAALAQEMVQFLA